MIDLRSDTVTRPTTEMLRHMMRAETGDDVYGEDPTVIELEERVAELFGMARGLFVPTGVMANQLGLKVLTRHGDEVIAGERSHIFNYETAAPAYLSGLQVHTVDDPDGRIEPALLEPAIREDVYYMPRTSVIAQENSHNKTSGKITTVAHHRSVAKFARDRDISLHLDGARLWNTLVRTGESFEEIGAICDTLSVCLSKGLGAPVGSVLLGEAEHIDQAWRYRKMWGGGWRQAGILAAAGLYALDHHVDRLVEDHEKASRFHAIIEESELIDAGDEPDTNIVVFRMSDTRVSRLIHDAKDEAILISGAFKGALRAVFHYDVSMEEAVKAAEFVAAWKETA